jgi:hypothetical protein
LKSLSNGWSGLTIQIGCLLVLIQKMKNSYAILSNGGMNNINFAPIEQYTAEIKGNKN